MIEEPRCSKRKCKHLVGVTGTGELEVDEVAICMAFPLGIPDSIAYGVNDHLSPIDGQDNQIVFEVDND